jgi:hypothetical protein
MLLLVAWQAVWNQYKADFTQRVKAKVQLKSSIPIGAKVEITLGVKPLNQVEGWSHYFKTKEVVMQCNKDLRSSGLLSFS